ncbi:hypothetical protein PGTUg99_005954 [Puccinia graminis f. sp. tritici]|uniref:Uncharacterized protein n=1 Tax=Puccinia graminis f. sp. tritici TaxID=56615 RepID=A0A5B0RWT9_PUCGR|nr:hypothetical protein PGTUg99_005954 [Puccinia graminis f. sp. tritici]
MLPALESLASVAYRLVRVSERAPIELGVPVEMPFHSVQFYPEGTNPGPQNERSRRLAKA